MNLAALKMLSSSLDQNTITNVVFPSVLVIDEDALRASIIEAGLRFAGQTNVTVVQNLNEIARRIADVAPDVIIIDLQKPGADLLQSLFQLVRAVARPVAMFVDQSDPETTKAAIDAGVSAYVINGFGQDRIKPVIELAISRFNATSRIARELAEAKSELENRKIIERAKGLIMASRKIDESEAYALLRTSAMKQSRTIADVAQNLVVSAGLLEL